MHKHLPLVLILTVFASFSGFLAYQNDIVWWDSSVYIGMGKYLWSFGESGFIEPSRPIVLPLLFGLFWKIGVNEIIAVKIIAVLFSVGVITLTYALGKRLYDGNVGILAALFLGFSQTFLFFSGHPLTEIPSTLFLMLGIWLFFEKKHMLSGVLLGLSFLTRFFQAFFIAFFLITIFFSIKNRKIVIEVLKGLGFVIAPYLLFSWILFGGPLDPFIMQVYLSMNTGVIYSESWFFYVIELLEENFFVLALLALPFIKMAKENKLVVIPTLLTFLIYSIFSHKEMRLLLVILPFILIATAHSLVSLFHLSSKWNKELSKAFSISLIAFWLVLSFGGNMGLFSMNKSVNSQEELFQAYMNTYQDKEFWISNPTYALFSDAKVSGLMYYPIITGVPHATLVNSCDFLGNNDIYTEKTMRHVALIEQSMDTIYTATENGCTYRIFEKTTS